jgi:hypothetical protein
LRYSIVLLAGSRTTPSTATLGKVALRERR